MTTEAGFPGRPLHTFAVAAALSLTAATARAGTLEVAAPADPCAGQACRELTAEERAAFGRALARIMGLLPTPAPDRYEQSGLKSLQGLAPFLVTDAVWQSAAFPTNVVDAVGVPTGSGVFPRTLGLVYSYSLKSEAERARLGLAQTFHTSRGGEMEVFDLRVEVTASPTPLVAPSRSGGARVVQQSRDALVVELKLPEEERGATRLAVLLGARAGLKAAAARLDGEAAGAAPVRAVRIDVQGPAADVKSLVRKLDRKAFKAMLEPAPAAQGPARRAPRK